jgi:hypothetical protein
MDYSKIDYDGHDDHDDHDDHGDEVYCLDYNLDYFLLD